MTYTEMKEAEQVTDEVLRQAEEIFEGWFDNEDKIDWLNFWDRLEMTYGWTITQLDCPAVKKIQKHVRWYKNQ